MLSWPWPFWPSPPLSCPRRRSPSTAVACRAGASASSGWVVLAAMTARLASAPDGIDGRGGIPPPTLATERPTTRSGRDGAVDGASCGAIARPRRWSSPRDRRMAPAAAASVATPKIVPVAAAAVTVPTAATPAVVTPAIVARPPHGGGSFRRTAGMTSVSGRSSRTRVESAHGARTLQMAASGTCRVPRSGQRLIRPTIIRRAASSSTGSNPRYRG